MSRAKVTLLYKEYGKLKTEDYIGTGETSEEIIKDAKLALVYAHPSAKDIELYSYTLLES